MRAPEMKTQSPSGSRGRAGTRISNLPPWLSLLCMVIYIKEEPTTQVRALKTLDISYSHSASPLARRRPDPLLEPREALRLAHWTNGISQCLRAEQPVPVAAGKRIGTPDLLNLAAASHVGQCSQAPLSVNEKHLTHWCGSGAQKHKISAISVQ